MERIMKHFSYDHTNDTAIEYVSTKMYSMLNCSFTSEDPDYGTDTIHFVSHSVKPFERLAYEMLTEVHDFLDWHEGTDDSVMVNAQNDYDQYSNSTMYAIENALAEITRKYNPKCWYMKPYDFARMAVQRFREYPETLFAFCPSDEDEARENPEQHKSEGGWHGVQLIKAPFDNDDSEFIAMVGYYGGGTLELAYVPEYEADNLEECESALFTAICNASGCTAESWIYVEDDTKEEGK